MRHVGLMALGIGVLAGAGLLAADPAYPGVSKPGCTLATLNGQYLFAGSGTLFPPAFGVKTTSVANSAGYHIFNGDGTGTDTVTFTVNGINQNVPSPVAITYSLNADCTGTYAVHKGPTFNIYVAVDGSELTVIDTGKGTAFSEGPDWRVGPSP
jgi:hypothetical protein